MKHLLNNATQGSDKPWVTLDNEEIVHYSGLTAEDPLAALFNGYEAVDLGLTTDNGNHLLFANCNVGASEPTDNGKYFQWGATEGYYKNEQGAKDNSTWITTPYQTAQTSDYNQTKFTKYLGSTSSSFKDPSATDANALKTTLDPSDDAAHVNMGGSWRMPTAAEFQELYDNTTCTWVTIDGVNGRKFTSKTNGNYIFIPASGYFRYGSFYSGGSNGYGWSSSLCSSNPYYALNLLFNSGVVYPQGNFNRYYGFPVRGVIELTEEQYQLYLNK